MFWVGTWNQCWIIKIINSFILQFLTIVVCACVTTFSVYSAVFVETRYITFKLFFSRRFWKLLGILNSDLPNVSTRFTLLPDEILKLRIFISTIVNVYTGPKNTHHCKINIFTRRIFLQIYYNTCIFSIFRCSEVNADMMARGSTLCPCIHFCSLPKISSTRHWHHTLVYKNRHRNIMCFQKKIFCVNIRFSLRYCQRLFN